MKERFTTTQKSLTISIITAASIYLALYFDKFIGTASQNGLPFTSLSFTRELKNAAADHLSPTIIHPEGVIEMDGQSTSQEILNWGSDPNMPGKDACVEIIPPDASGVGGFGDMVIPKCTPDADINN